MTDKLSQKGADMTAQIFRIIEGLPIYECIAILETVKFSIQMTSWENTGGITMTVAYKDETAYKNDTKKWDDATKVD